MGCLIHEQDWFAGAGGLGERDRIGNDDPVKIAGRRHPA
jgi:hypothetical protein